MSEFSRRRFLKVSAAGVSLGVVIEACGGPASEESGGTMPPSGATGADPDRGGGRAPGNSQPSPAPEPSGNMTVEPPTEPPPTQTQPPGQQPPPAEPPPGQDPPPAEPQPPAVNGMPQRPLGNTGLMISVVGFGSGSRYMMASEAEAERMIHRAIELGITYFDTARSYGSEPRLGRHLIPMYRNRIVLTSKSAQRTADGARRELEQTLQALGTDHLDIFHFHHIDRQSDTDRIVGPGGALEAYQKAKEEGLIRFIGLSGHSTGALLVDALTRIKPDVVMCPQNAAREDGFTDRVLTYGKQNGIGLLGMKVTAQDALMRNGVTPQELLRYSLSLPITSMIVGMRSMAVLESCADVASKFQPLSEAEMSALNAKYASLDIGRCLPYHRPGYRDGVCFA